MRIERTMAKPELPEIDGSDVEQPIEDERRQVVAEYALSLREILDRLHKGDVPGSVEFLKRSALPP
jgi:hypothetical protein